MNQRWHIDLRAGTVGLFVSGSLLAVGSGCQARLPEDVGPSTGHYIWGAEVNVFSPCGSDQEYWVAAAPDIMGTLRERYVDFDLPPYTAVFVTLRGEFGPVLECGFCAEYDGSFKVTELVEMELPGPEDCVSD